MRVNGYWMGIVEVEVGIKCQVLKVELTRFVGGLDEDMRERVKENFKVCYVFLYHK